MLTLAIDTSAKSASAVLLSDGKIISEATCNNGNTHTQTILPMVDRILENANKKIDDIDLLAASNGPGSFTGIRIGAAVIKGLAFGRSIPCIGVSTLESLAHNLSLLKGIICPVMDARREQVYNALFYCDGEKTVRLTPDRAISLDELAVQLKELQSGEKKDIQNPLYTDRIYLVGDGYELSKKVLSEKLIKTEDTPIILREQNAASVAFLAQKKYEMGERSTDLDFSLSYLRMSQAERERAEKMS
ncbi:MAG: tRNA (adenosine(37)-N6)-threonylcarbamoyltransferase complex dimerization subunit type 1 TsaB [Eubacteriales bacterium]|nr:tRNA (adenosine(37)-N6)-threonylcarbamoyltransferase complex dimerization subunit type 1 TsaB [Eubacteriales bacterium]